MIIALTFWDELNKTELINYNIQYKVLGFSKMINIFKYIHLDASYIYLFIMYIW